MDINFYADSDLNDYTNSVNTYKKIWESDGDKIISTWRRLTDLEFQEKFINAIVSNNKSFSHPLNLRHNYPESVMRSMLVHELGHRILYMRIEGMRSVSSLGHHKLLYLILHNVILELYGEDTLKETIEFESALTPDYKAAWEWAESFSDSERVSLFRKVLAGDLSIIK